MEQYTGAEAFLEICNANGIDNIFFNPGGEFASINTAVLAPGVSIHTARTIAIKAME